MEIAVTRYFYVDQRIYRISLFILYFIRIEERFSCFVATQDSVALGLNIGAQFIVPLPTWYAGMGAEGKGGG